jgi:hypothetical protein
MSRCRGLWRRLHVVALFVSVTMLGHRRPVTAPRFDVVDAVSDVGPLGMAGHGCGSCRGVPTSI